MKAILVIDMPTSCLEDCIVSCNKFNAKGTPIPKECPLRPLPQKLDANDWHRLFDGEYAIREAKGHGYNFCLDEILGDYITQEEADLCGVQLWHDD